jgi:hypothetical protein
MTRESRFLSPPMDAVVSHEVGHPRTRHGQVASSRAADKTKQVRRMRACVSNRRLVVDNVADPRPEPGQVLVRSLACCINGRLEKPTIY